MNSDTNETELQIIDVPPELRGPSDEEIIRNSQIKNTSADLHMRPSKKKRDKQKKLANTANSINNATEPILQQHNKVESNLVKEICPQKTSELIIKPMISAPLKPASGRVLKASFLGAGTSPKAEIISAADLEKQRTAEREKKIRNLVLAKNPTATTMPDGQPIKRPRGRPRKKPLF